MQPTPPILEITDLVLAPFGKRTTCGADRLTIARGDVIAIDGKALRGARGKSESAKTRMMVSAYASRLRLTLATVTADRGAELQAAIEALDDE